jgi:hypothetical protein
MTPRAHLAASTHAVALDGETPVQAVERLLGAGRHQAALELAAAFAESVEALPDAVPLISELQRIHFGGEAVASVRVESAEPQPAAARASEGIDFTLASVRAAARLRPHATGSLTAWEQALLLARLSHPHRR